MAPNGAAEDLEVSFGRVATRTRKREDQFESREHFVASVDRSRTLERLAPGLVELIAETTHFLQLEKPDACADAMGRFLDETGLA